MVLFHKALGFSVTCCITLKNSPCVLPYGRAGRKSDLYSMLYYTYYKFKFDLRVSNGMSEKSLKKTTPAGPVEMLRYINTLRA